MTAPLLTTLSTFWLYSDGWDLDDNGRLTIPVRRRAQDGPADVIELVIPIEGYSAMLYRSDTDANAVCLCRLESHIGSEHYILTGTGSALAEFAKLFDKEE